MSTTIDLPAVLAAHEKWLWGESGGERANLRDADLWGANLGGADLGGANLRGANLGGANLWGANLRGANLRDANLGGADLRDANLRGANLGGANLSDADLRDANLGGADLRDANLGGADLGGANLRGANLGDANLGGARNLDPLAAARLLITPEAGAFDAWKQCRNGVLVRLRIPDGVPRHNATGRKCRAERAVVLEVVGAAEGISHHDPTVIYRVGETVVAANYDPDRWNECGGGIHFYLTRAEAEAHQ